MSRGSTSKRKYKRANKVRVKGKTATSKGMHWTSAGKQHKNVKRLQATLID